MNRSSEYGFYLPQNTDPISVNDFNYNFDVIDDNMLSKNEQTLTSAQKSQVKSNLGFADQADLDALSRKINVPDWSNPTNNICTVSNVGWTATGYGFIRVNAQWDRGGQLNINGATIYYVDKSYYGGINFHVEWLVPVKTGDIVKLIADNGTLPTGMSATFYPIR